MVFIKVFYILVILMASASAMFDKNGKVIELTAKNFDKEVL